MIAMRTRSKNTANAALLLLCVAQLMVLLDASIVQIALPSIQQEFGAASGRLQWITTAYTLCFGGFLLVGSRLGDRFGRRPRGRGCSPWHPRRPGSRPPSGG
ncbi:MAG: hypothetical protein C6W59_13330 [Paenibacillaceae bacterium]|nr:MAG: hypothetical protein C6W59_13330 [Paenibacillaceae bacterium]